MYLELTKDECNEINTLLIYATMHPHIEFEFHQNNNSNFVNEWYRMLEKWINKTKNIEI